MQVIKYSLGILTTILLLVILWMNITPGHFQEAYCGCDIEYYEYPKEKIEGLMCPAGCIDKNILGKIFDSILLKLSILDLTK